MQFAWSWLIRLIVACSSPGANLSLGCCSVLGSPVSSLLWPELEIRASTAGSLNSLFVHAEGLMISPFIPRPVAFRQFDELVSLVQLGRAHKAASSQPVSHS